MTERTDQRTDLRCTNGILIAQGRYTKDQATKLTAYCQQNCAGGCKASKINVKTAISNPQANFGRTS